MSVICIRVLIYTLPYLTLPYLTLPYLTLPYLTLPYLTSLHQIFSTPPLISNYINIFSTETARYYNELKRYNYTTPTSYLELIKLYVDILKKQQESLSANERRYRVGLDKLRETEEIVAKLEVICPKFKY